MNIFFLNGVVLGTGRMNMNNKRLLQKIFHSLSYGSREDKGIRSVFNLNHFGQIFIMFFPL